MLHSNRKQQRGCQQISSFCGKRKLAHKNALLKQRECKRFRKSGAGCTRRCIHFVLALYRDDTFQPRRRTRKQALLHLELHENSDSVWHGRRIIERRITELTLCIRDCRQTPKGSYEHSSPYVRFSLLLLTFILGMAEPTIAQRARRAKASPRAVLWRDPGDIQDAICATDQDQLRWLRCHLFVF